MRFPRSSRLSLNRGGKIIFTGSYISLTVAFRGLNVISRLYKGKYSLTRGKELGAVPRKKRCWARFNNVEGQIWPTCSVFAPVLYKNTYT